MMSIAFGASPPRNGVPRAVSSASTIANASSIFAWRVRDGRVAEIERASHQAPPDREGDRNGCALPRGDSVHDDRKDDAPERQQVKVREAARTWQQQALQQLLDECDVALALGGFIAEEPFARAQPAVESVQRLARPLPCLRGAHDDRNLDAAAPPQRERRVQERRVPFFVVGNAMALEQPARQFHHRTDARRHDHVARRIEILRADGPGVADHDRSDSRTVYPAAPRQAPDFMRARAPVRLAATVSKPMILKTKRFINDLSQQRCASDWRNQSSGETHRRPA